MPGPYRFTRPVSKRDATGEVASVYAQMNDEFILTDGPLMSLSPAPEVLTATWSLLREAQLAGRAPRLHKEVVATAISSANHCRFCVNAHAMLIHATGEHDIAKAVRHGETPADSEIARLANWARATADPHHAATLDRPFADDLATEYLGTVLVNHFINRMTSSLLDETVLVGRLQDSALVRRFAGRVLGRTMQTNPRPGGSLALLAGRSIGSPPEWAGGSAAGIAYAALRAASGAGGRLLSAPAWDAVMIALAHYQGDPAPRGDGWLDEALAGLSDADRPGARLALLAAFTPHAITAADVAAWKAAHFSDADLIRVLAFGAMAAVERIEAALQAPPVESPAEVAAAREAVAV